MKRWSREIIPRSSCKRYEQVVKESWIIPELRKVRNFHSAPTRTLAGSINAGRKS